jgi:hypothetical protein
MRYNYKILNFDPQQGLITVQFEGYDPFACYAPFINGAYLTGTALDDYIQTLYIQAIPYENRAALVQGLAGADEISALVEPIPEYVDPTPDVLPEPVTPAQVISVQPLKSTYYMGESLEAIITFDKPINPLTFVNIMFNIKSSPPVYLPSEYEAVAGSMLPLNITLGVNGEKLEMYLGDTTAKYTSPVYTGGLSYNEATISAKTVLNQIDRQQYVVSAPIQLISESIPNA